MLNELSAVSADEGVAAAPVGPATEELPAALVMLARDDDLVCIDDVCAPVEPVR